MDDILASIRRIISEDGDSPPAPARAEPMPRVSTDDQSPAAAQFPSALSSGPHEDTVSDDLSDILEPATPQTSGSLAALAEFSRSNGQPATAPIGASHVADASDWPFGDGDGDGGAGQRSLTSKLSSLADPAQKPAPDAARQVSAGAVAGSAEPPLTLDDLVQSSQKLFPKEEPEAVAKKVPLSEGRGASTAPAAIDSVMKKATREAVEAELQPQEVAGPEADLTLIEVPAAAQKTSAERAEKPEIAGISSADAGSAGALATGAVAIEPVQTAGAEAERTTYEAPSAGAIVAPSPVAKERAGEPADKVVAPGAAPVVNGPAPSKSLEGVVIEALEPMLREWLDANLSRIVEETVQRELTRRKPVR